MTSCLGKRAGSRSRVYKLNYFLGGKEYTPFGIRPRAVPLGLTYIYKQSKKQPLKVVPFSNIYLVNLTDRLSLLFRHDLCLHESTSIRLPGAVRNKILRITLIAAHLFQVIPNQLANWLRGGFETGSGPFAGLTICAIVRGRLKEFIKFEYTRRGGGNAMYFRSSTIR